MRLYRLCLLEIGHRKVADPDEPDLAAIHQLLHRRHGLRDGNGVVRPVQLVEVDVANAQALEALIGGLQQVSAPEVPRQRLRREEHPVPDTANCLADDLFCSVGLCGVDQMGAELDRLPER